MHTLIIAKTIKYCIQGNRIDYEYTLFILEKDKVLYWLKGKCNR